MKIKGLIPSITLFDCIERNAEMLNRILPPEYTLLYIEEGAIRYTTKLLRYLNQPSNITSVKLKSYIGSQSKELKWINDIECKGLYSTVLVVDDILDTGKTIKAVLEKLQSCENVKHVITSVMLYKQRIDLVPEIEPNYYALKIPDVFVIGYGLDYNGRFRELDEIAYIEEEEEV